MYSVTCRVCAALGSYEGKDDAGTVAQADDANDAEAGAEHDPSVNVVPA